MTRWEFTDASTDWCAQNKNKTSVFDDDDDDAASNAQRRTGRDGFSRHSQRQNRTNKQNMHVVGTRAKPKQRRQVCTLRGCGWGLGGGQQPLPIVRLDVLDGLAVVLEHVDAHHGPVESRVGALDHLVVQVLAAQQARAKKEQKKKAAREQHKTQNMH